MYRKDKDGRKERRKDIKRLWNLLHNDSVRFSENIEWFGRKAIDSEVPRNYEIMFSTYLSVMIKVDNRLFLGRTYWNINSKRIDLVYWLLMTCGYAERMIELALGAANLYAQTKHKQHTGKVTELIDVVELYKTQLEQHRRNYTDGQVNRRAKWEMIRTSNQVFAKIYDIVENGTLKSYRLNTYTEHLTPSREDWRDCPIYWILYDELVLSRYGVLKRLIRKTINTFKRIKRVKRNKRRRINWEEI